MSDPAERAALDALVGRTVQGRYRIDALLGMGGMGGVFRAHHLGLGRDVALKVLHAGVRASEIATARFQREARSASRLDHPNCVRVTDFGELEDGTKFLVMQLLSGEELRSRLDRPFDPREAIDVALQILAGLAHAHAQGVVHRDLKPENVLLVQERDGARRVKLVDFGIAKLIEGDDADPKLTRTGMLFGTPRYMSPEQAGGGKVDARTDLYAVGLLLYEMLAGHAPFAADDVASLMRMHVLVPPPPLPERVPPTLAAVVMRLLAKARADRFADAHETIAALEHARAELGGASEVAPTQSGAQAWTPPSELAPTMPTWGPQVPTRRTFTQRQLFAAAAVVAVFWLGVLVYVLAGSSAPTPPSVPPPAAAARPAVDAPKRIDPAPPVQNEHTCRGEACMCEGAGTCELACTDDCDLWCEGSRACRFACGDDCEVECGGRAQCTLDVGDGSRVECKGSSRCAVTCRGACTVKCKGKVTCDVRCIDGTAPLRCGKDLRACGSCR